MTRLGIAAVLVAVTGLSTPAQNPGRPLATLEGTWREPLRPGDRAEDKLVVTVTGQEITVTWCGEVYRGSCESDPDRGPVLVQFTITLSDGKGEYFQRTHRGLCLLKGNQLFIQIQPASSAVDRTKLDLAPLSFRVEKLKK